MPDKTCRSISRDIFNLSWYFVILYFVPTFSTISRGKPKGVLRKKEQVAVPLQVWSGPEGSRKLRFPHFMTATQDSGKVVSLTHRPHLPPGNTPSTHFY